MKRKILILRLYLNYCMYFFNTYIRIGFNIANLFCKIELLDCLFNFLFRIVWIKKYLDHRGYRGRKLNDEARIICHLTIRDWIYYNIMARNYFRKSIFEKTIFNIGRVCLLCSFAKDLETSIKIWIFYDGFDSEGNEYKIFNGNIEVSLFGFRICLRKY